MVTTATVGRAMRVLGYDRDFAAMTLDGPPLQVRVGAVPGWQSVEIDRSAVAVELQATQGLTLRRVGT